MLITILIFRVHRDMIIVRYSCIHLLSEDYLVVSYPFTEQLHITPELLEISSLILSFLQPPSPL